MWKYPVLIALCPAAALPARSMRCCPRHRKNHGCASGSAESYAAAGTCMGIGMCAPKTPSKPLVLVATPAPAPTAPACERAWGFAAEMTTPHSQFRHVILGRLDALSLTRRPLDNRFAVSANSIVSTVPSERCFMSREESPPRHVGGSAVYTYHALSDRFALPT